MLTTRLLVREELPLIWTIDRREVIEYIYRLQDGNLVLEAHHVDVPGWAPGRQGSELPQFEECFDRGGRFHAAFDGATLAGVAIADSKPVATRSDLVELKFLHVGRPYRGLGVGADLFARALESAREFGASGLYVSATPTQRTIEFYLGRGCTVLATPDPELFELEPEDIHLEGRRQAPGASG